MSLNRKLSWLSQVLPVLNNLPDIFHIQWGKSIESWMFLKYKFGVKIVLSLRGTHINCSPLNDENLRNVYRENFPNIDRFHAVSKSLANEALKYGAQKKRIDIISSPINSKLIKIKKDNWEIDNIFKILSVGRNKWVKGFHIALSAIKEICDIGININYTIITPDAPSEEILYQIDDLQLYEKVFLKTYTDQNKVFQFMSKSDCLLLPSLTEGIANVALEAMLIQLPVISSDCGGMSELIKNGYNGYLFKNRNYNSCVKVLNNFLKLPAKEKKIIAMNAKSTIEKNNEIQIIGKKLKYFYQNC
jgi:colanic acid/amylovoran biosynthesis glycosyltransferase